MKWVGDQRRRNTRSLTIAEAMDRLQREIDLIGGKYSILSSNLELRLTRAPRSGQRDPDDPGVAVYFTLKGRRVVLACDKWDRAADNIAAIAAHVDAMRGQERWGVGSLEQAFAGYAKLPSPERARHWINIFGFDPGSQRPSLQAVEARYRELAARHHPDVTGGSHEQFAELSQAILAARKELSA